MNFLQGQPVRCDNIRVEWPLPVFSAAVAAKGYAQESVVPLCAAPAIYADQRLGLELPGRFFQAFPDSGVNQAFIVFQVTGWLIEAYRSVYVFLDH